MKKMKVRLTFVEELLGTESNNPEIHAEFIASKAPDAKSREEEIASIGADEEIAKAMTVFSKDANGNPHLWDYQIKGFFKSAAKACNDAKIGEKVTAYKKKIDTLVFLDHGYRTLPLHIPEGGKIGSCQRPLRAQTAQGERITLANSETVPAGTWIEFVVICMDDSLMKHVPDWLDYGQWNGIGQWRNSSKGRFKWARLSSEKDGANWA